MLKEGLKKREIIKQLERKLSQDCSYQSEYILGSMCSEPINFGKEIYMKYISKNLGDPGLFKDTAKIENELIRELGELFGARNIVGSITTGGTEANIIAMRIARKLRPEIKKPEFIIPDSAHKSFDKGEDLMLGGLTLRRANLTKDFKLDLEHFKTLINENTCGVLGIAGTTSLGLIDPIDKIGEIIEGRNIFFHIDAAFGGFILPFLRELNYMIPPWDFRVTQVSSITADPHKMGLAPIPTGGYFLRDGSILNKIGFNIPYLAGGDFKHLHIVGTRPGGQVIAFWAILKYLGIEGYTKIVKQCMDNTKYLEKLISEIEGIKLAAKSEMNIVGITTESGESVTKLDDELRKRKWMLGKFKKFNLIRVVIMPHVKKAHLTKFSQDLEGIAKKLNL
ncbi:MAG: tyrosine decarboxylase MfnA [Promethearchaeota archaeon]|nr:MAG: tyrosine decarboxylase MfnA [Candidatus Lokiarchaeota archaeon]